MIFLKNQNRDFCSQTYDFHQNKKHTFEMDASRLFETFSNLIPHQTVFTEPEEELKNVLDYKLQVGDKVK